MFYEQDITLAINGTEATATPTEINLRRGILTKAAIQFPSGCAGLVHAKINMGGIQLFPRNQRGNIKGDGVVVEMEDAQEIGAGRNRLTVYAWNEDDTYTHMITVRFTVLPAELVYPYVAFGKIANALELLLRRVGVIRL
jgi:hypothetical protein